MIRATILFLLLTSTALAGDSNYWTIEIPAISGATNVSHERDERHYVISSSYEVVLEDTQKIYAFYRDFFEKLDWKKPMESFSRSKNEYHESWNTYRSTVNSRGLPESSYSSMWKAKNIPARGTVNLTLTGFKDGKFNAKISVLLAPEIDTSPLFQISEIMMRDPKNFFILYSAFGGNPLEIDKINPRPSEEHKNNETVKEYYGLVETVFKQYREFGDCYIKKW